MEQMKSSIQRHLNHPQELERLYRMNRLYFKREFNRLYPELEGNAIANTWNERLNYETDEINWGTRKEVLFVILIALAAGILAKLPAFLSIDKDFFYSRNIGFIIFPMLTAYFAWKNKLSIGKIAIITGTTFIGLLFINLFPDVQESDTLMLSCLHIPLFLWSILGFAFVGGKQNNREERLEFLTYNGELVVITTLFVIAGALMTGITIGLFSLIGFDIEEFYFENIVIFVLPSAPIIGTYLAQVNPQLVSKVSPVIAKIFSPLVLVMLLIYLAAMVYAGKNPYNDREFLLIFNLLLVGVMAIIFFSVAEASQPKSKTGIAVLFLLSAITLVVNGIALSAIVFRISEWGFTPNRTAVLGSNLLILINLIVVATQLFKVLSKKTDITGVSKTIAFYLPIYVLWTIIVTFIFPLIFGFK